MNRAVYNQAFFALLGAACLGSASVCGARADDTGVGQMLHDLRREGKKLCMTTHFHDGQSSGEATKKAAEMAAVKAWAEFTAWEYGTDWAQWTKASGKTMSCAQSGSTWGCHVEARPCK